MMHSKYFLYVSSSYIFGIAGLTGILMWVKWQKHQMKRFLNQWYKQKIL